MRGVILAGGSGSRLYPLTTVTNKHLLPIGSEPMIFHPIRKLIEVGVREIMLVTGTEHAGAIFSLLGSGSQFSARFTYRVQDEPGGIAQALGLAEDFVRNEPFCALLADNIFSSDLRAPAQRFSEYAGRECWDARGMVLLHRVADPGRYGVAELDQLGRLLSIEEKPKQPRSNWAVSGIYFYAGSEIFELIRSSRPSDRGELEISDLNTGLLRRERLIWSELPGWWTDAGTPASYWKANQLIRDLETV